MESQKPKYANLSHVDDRDDSRSSTEVEDSLMGDEKQWHDIELNRPTTRTTRLGRFVAAVKSSRWMIDTALLLIILALLVRDQWSRPVPEEKEANPWQFGQDMTGVGPRRKCSSKSREDTLRSILTRPSLFKDNNLRKGRVVRPEQYRRILHGRGASEVEWPNAKYVSMV